MTDKEKISLFELECYEGKDPDTLTPEEIALYQLRFSIKKYAEAIGSKTCFVCGR